MPHLRLERGEPVDVADRPARRDDASAAIGAYERLKPGPGKSQTEVSSHQRARIKRAMVEVVVKRGYKRATIREIASVAGISTRALYQHYSTKEECFLRTHRIVGQRLLRRVEDAGSGAERDVARVKAVVSAITHEWGHSPELARFFLFSPYEAGPAALRQLRLADRSLAVWLASGCVPDSRDKRLANMVSAGIIAGLFDVGRALILDDRGRDLLEIRNDLAQWASAYLSCLPGLEAFGASRAQIQCGEGHWHPGSSSKPKTEDRAASPLGDAAFLCSAVTRIAASGDRSELTIRNVCTTAGLSRASFYAHFSDLGECIAEAQEIRMRISLAHASRVAEIVPAGASKVCCGLNSFCMQVAHDPGLSNLCFGEFVASGEWSARRERRLIESLAGLLDAAGHTSHAKEHPILFEASLGAALGLIRREIETGSSNVLHQMTPSIGYLTLASVDERGVQANWAQAS